MVQFSESFEADDIFKLLSRSLPYYLGAWKSISCTFGYFGRIEPTTFNMRQTASSSPVIEYVVRPHLQILVILSACVHANNFPEEIELSRGDMMEYVEKGVAWACATHLTGTHDVESFLDRKRWGENWRSGLWTSLLCLATFMSKDYLSPQTLDKVHRVLAFEADRFIDVRPPSGCETDTKVEENAQDVMVMAWAINFLPDHPHVNAWKKSLAIWAVNIATSIKDTADHTNYLDKSVKHWVSTQTLFPDMTAENHGFFHPEIFTYGAWVVLAMAAYRMHGRQVPFFFHRKNHQKTFDALLRFCLPNGMLYAPASNDLPLFYPRPFALAWGLWNNDPRAMRITTKLLTWMSAQNEASRENEGVPWIGGFAGSKDGWELLFESQVGMELALLAILPFPTEQRFYSLGQIESSVDTRHIYPYVELCYRRNSRSTRSVSWKALGKHPVVGMNIHSYPELLCTSIAGMLGIPRVDDSRLRYWEVAFHHDHFQKDGFETFGRIDYYNDAKRKILRREMRVLTWGDDGIIVLDRLIAETELYFPEQYLSPIHLVNDRWTGGRLELTSGSLHEIIESEDEDGRELSCPSFWASIESTLLFQFIWGRTKGLTYIPATRPNAPRYWKNCRLDTLAIRADAQQCIPDSIPYEVGFFLGTGKSPRPFKSAGNGGELFRGLVIMDGKSNVGLS